MKKALLYIIPALFFFCSLLYFTGNLKTWRGDERFYTDGAIRMLQTGDILTPRYSNGSIRLNKPPLTYWASAISAKLTGISLFSMRLPSLLAGTVLISLTAALTFVIFNSYPAALLSTLIMISLRMIIKMSIRVTPDMLLCLFITLSIFSFIRIIFAGDRRLRTYMIAWLCIAFAILTKGLYAPLIAMLIALWVFIKHPAGSSIKDLGSLPVLLLAVITAGWWYAAMAAQHGHELTSQLITDQASGRLHGISVTLILTHLLNHVLFIIRNFIPWSLAVIYILIAQRKKFAAFARQYAIPLQMALILTSVSVIVFSSGNIFRARYLLPIYPLLCSITAGLIIYIFEIKTIHQRAFIICIVASMLSMAANLGVIGLKIHGICLPSSQVVNSLAKNGHTYNRIMVVSEHMPNDLAAHLRILSSGKLIVTTNGLPRKLNTGDALVVTSGTNHPPSTVANAKWVPTGIMKRNNKRICYCFTAVPKNTDTNSNGDSQ